MDVRTPHLAGIHCGDHDSEENQASFASAVPYPTVILYRKKRAYEGGQVPRSGVCAAAIIQKQARNFPAECASFHDLLRRCLRPPRNPSDTLESHRTDDDKNKRRHRAISHLPGRDERLASSRGRSDQI